MITRIEAYHYRCFAQIDVELGSYNVVAGANGSGKTTLLDVPVLLGDMLRQEPLTAFLKRAHTLRELIHKEHGDEIRFTIEARLPDDVAAQQAGRTPGSGGEPTDSYSARLRYELRFRPLNGRELCPLDEDLVLSAGISAKDHRQRGQSAVAGDEVAGR